ncbi:MAG: DUF2298 domain-containing protein, partial [Chloroflexia bacterium]
MSLANNTEQVEEIEYEIVDEARPSFWERYRTPFLLAVILTVAAFFRFFDRNFDQGTSQHPDEIAIVGATLGLQWPSSFDQVFNPGASPLNLRASARYPWGALPVYISRAAAWVADQAVQVVNPSHNNFYIRDYWGAQMVGRTMASIFDLITILLVFLIARRLYSTRTALIAAALVALAVTHIQIAHFYITEPFLVAFMMAGLYFSVVLMQKPSWWAAAGAGLFVGLSVASKVTSALVFLMVIAAVVLRAAYRKRSRKLGADLDDPVGVVPASATERSFTFGQHFRRGLRYVLIAALFSLVGFSLTEPYALWQFDYAKIVPAQGQTFQDSVKDFLMSNPWGQVIVEEAAHQSGESDVPYTRQYVGTVPVLFHFEQLIFWGVGVVPGLIMLAGLLLALWLALKRRPAELMLLSFAIPYFLTILIGETKWMRYMLPLVPVFAIMAAAFLERGARWAAQRWPRTEGERGFTVRGLQRSFFPVLTVASLTFALLWSIAFLNIYTHEHTRVRANQWANANLPAGASISHEGWDRDLPGLVGFRTGDEYIFNLYDDRAFDDEFNYIKDLMSKVDVISLTSNRLYGSIPRLPWRYPVQIRFYQLLFAEKLGYVRVHTEHITPEIFGIKFDDQLADESFTVYDHPRVDLFQKVSTLTEDQLRTLFSPALNFPMEEYSATRHSTVYGDKSLMYDEPLSAQPEVGDYAWNPLAQEDTQWIGVALWLLAVYLLGFAAMPIVFTVMRRLPDRGYAFAKLAGLLVVSWIVWLLASARLVPFTFWSVLFALVLLSAFSLLLWRLGARFEIRDFIRRKRNLIIFYEGLFLLAFVLMLFIRMLNPDVWHTVFGGEKTMEFGFLNSTLRSPWMPPADPFFAGGYVNYYYHGQFIIACLIKLVGIDPAIAFNLGLTVIYALTFIAAASIVYNLVAWSRARRGSIHEVSRVGMAFGLLGGVLMMVIGNLSSIVMWIMVVFPGTAAGLLDLGRNLGLNTEGFTRPFTEFYFWPPSRVIPFTINEFPFWSFLYGDLHPHLIDMPFTLMATALAVNIALAGRYIPSLASAGAGWFADLRARALSALQWMWGHGWAGLLTFALTALTLGGLFVTNSWDFPTFVGLLGGAAFVALLLSRKAAPTDPDGRVLETVAPDKPLGLRGALTFTLAAFASVGVAALVAVLAYLPFFLNFKAFFTKLSFLVDGGLIPGTNFIMRRTTIWEFLAAWGIFMFIALSYLAVRLWNFPWRAALADLLGIVPGPQEPARQPSVATAGAITYEPSPEREQGLLVPLRRRRFALTPALSGATGSAQPSATVYFRTENRAEESAEEALQLSPEVPDSIAPVDTLPAHLPGEDTAGEDTGDGDHAHATIDAGPNGDSLVPLIGAREPDGVEDAEVASAPLEAYVYPGEQDVQAQPVMPNWVADAHIEDQRQRVVMPRPASYQPGVIPLWSGFAILAGTAAVTALQIATGQPVLALLIAIIGGLMGTLLSTTRSAAALAGGLVFVVGLIVVLGVEVVYLGDHNAGGEYYRMNTVFKFYVQAWMLIALGSAVAIYYILYGLRDRTEPGPQAGSLREDADIPPAEPLDFAALPSTPEIDSDLLHPNGATSTDNGHELDQPTVPLRAIHPTTNWLVWSTEEIAATDLPTTVLPEAADEQEPEQFAGTSAVHIEESIPPLVTRRLQSLAEPAILEEVSPPTTQETVEQPAARPEDLLTLKWTAGRAAWA